MSYLKRFLHHVEPKSDENLPGFLMRVAQANSPSLSLFSIGAIVEAQLSVTNSHRCFVERAEKLEMITGVSAERICVLGYPIITKESQGRTNCSAFGQCVPTGNFNLATGKVCVACLKVDPYVKQLWDLKLYGDCHIHKVELTHNCSGCGHYISWFRSSVTGCHKCGYDFRDTPTKVVSVERVEFAGYVAKLAGVQNSVADAFLARVPELSLSDLKHASATFALFWGIDNNHKTGGLGFLAQEEAGMRKSLNWLAEFFGAKWPAPFFDLIDATASRAPKRDASPVNKFRRLYKAISSISEGVNLPRFRPLFVEHLSKNYVGYLANAAASAGVIAEATTAAGIITCSDLEEKLSAPAAVIKAAAVSIGCRVFTRAGRYPVVRFYISDVERIAEAVELSVMGNSKNARTAILKIGKRRLTKARLGDQLGCSDNVAASVLRVGALGQAVMDDHAGTPRYVATEENVNALIQELEEAVQPRGVKDAVDLVCYSRRALTGTGQTYWIAHVIALIRAKYLVPCGIAKGAIGLRRILLSKADGRDFLKQKSKLPEVVELLERFGVRDKISNQIIPFRIQKAA